MAAETSTAAPGRKPVPDEGLGNLLPEALIRRLGSLPFGLHAPGVPRTRRGEMRAVRMIPSTLVTEGRRIRYSVSDNIAAHGPEGPGTPPIWAVNIHGYFAGGTMYWRESANIAEKIGWRVLNPNLPGFAGSDPLPWQRVSIGEIAEQVLCLMDNLGIERAVLLGHSMGGAVAVRIADSHPERVLGIIYRDGAATPEWKNRRGALVAILSPLLPGSANLVDLTLSVVLDSPDLLIGRRLSSTMRGLWPDTQHNLRSFGGIMPVGSMLMSLDMREEVSRLAVNRIPVLAEWGCFDRVVTRRCAQEFSELSGSRVIWVPGGHSWMLPRPQGQADILKHLGAGRAFLVRIRDRMANLADGTAGAESTDGGATDGRAGRVADGRVDGHTDSHTDSDTDSQVPVEPISILRQSTAG